jgi:hypothetical protein
MFLIDDTLSGLGYISEICSLCKNYYQDSIDIKNNKIGNCKAFPKGIPEKIWIGENDHKLPYKGDNGIQFEPIK